MHNLMVDDGVFGSWRQIAVNHKLNNDSDVAHFLIRLYEKANGDTSSSTCTNCHSPLTLCCARCNIPATQLNRFSPRSEEKLPHTKKETMSPFPFPKQQETDGEEADTNAEQLEGIQTESLQGLKAMPAGSKEPQQQITTTRSSPRRAKPSKWKLEILADRTSLGKSATSKQLKAKSVAHKQRSSGSSNLAKNPDLKPRRFGCTVCHRKFLGANDLRRHMRTHTGEKPFQCTECGLNFTLAKSLRNHKMRRICEKVSMRAIRKQSKPCSNRGRPRSKNLASELPSETGFSDTAENEEILSKKRPFVCKVCQRRFLGATDLKRHMRTHTGEKPYVCTECGKAFSLAHSLRSHIRRHLHDKPDLTSDSDLFLLAQVMPKSESEQATLTRTEDGRYSCDVCLKNFGRPRDLRVHMRVHTGEKPYVCEKCGKSFAYQHSLKAHNRVHSGKKSVFCSECGLAFFDTDALNVHMRLHTGDRPYLCEECGEAYTTPGTLQIHIRNTHIGEKPHKCETCSAAFKTARHLSIHQKIHTGDNPYKCTECGEAFSTYQALKVHRKMHTGKCEFKCTECESVFSTFNLLSLHRQTHSDTSSLHEDSDSIIKVESKEPLADTKTDSTGPFACNTCKAVVSTPAEWSRHLQSYCNKNQCTTCGASFKNGFKLREHIRTHTGEKPYVCTACNAGFRSNAQLKVHMRTHTGYKPHACEVCGKAFLTFCNLKLHMRSHTGERPFGCPHCSLAFTQHASLKRHLKTHSGDRPHVCEMCGACFTSVGTLKRHMHTHRQAGDRLIACSKCGTVFTIPANIQTGLGDGETVPICESCCVQDETAVIITDSADTDGNNMEVIEIMLVNSEHSIADSI